MNARVMTMSRRVPASVTAAAVAGWIGGALSWMIASGWRDLSSLISSYARLDQLVALLSGAVIGACVLGLRAQHRREPIVPALGAGALLGGVAATLGTTLGLVLRGSDTPVGFVMQRIATWALMSGAAAMALSGFTRTRRWRSSTEALAIGLVGGATAGALFSLPGPSEMWLPFAMTWCGATIGFAAVGPAIWHAPAVVQLLPPRDHRLSLWSLRERALDNDWSMTAAEGHIAAVDDVVYVYPPPSGAILDGYPLYRTVPITRDVLLAVGRMRFRITVGRR